MVEIGPVYLGFFVLGFPLHTTPLRTSSLGLVPNVYKDLNLLVLTLTLPHLLNMNTLLVGLFHYEPLVRLRSIW